MNLTPTLTTERLVLRVFTPDDVDFVFKHFSDPDVCRYLYDAEPFTEREEALGLIAAFTDPKRTDRTRWALELKSDGSLIGTCGYHFWDKTNRSTELGYDLAKPYWGQGLMPEALRAIFAFGFETMELNRIHAYTSVDNAQSVRLLQKMGFTNEGVVREKHCFRGAFYDHFCFSLLAREFDSHH
jgi:ribosomal-protein-alanine N-acetyltransferase